jgi:voltage-gated potassium channel Kch
VTNRDVLEHAGIFDAIGVLLTMPDEEAMLRSVRTIRSLRPDVLIAARAGVVSKSMQARELGADEVIVEELAGAELMAQRVLERLEERERG